MAQADLIVVADTSPLTNLHAIGRLFLLRDVFGRIVVPPAVAVELDDERSPVPLVVADYPWVEIRMPRDATGRQFSRPLDPGEAQALSLAIEVRADLVLLDERIARAEATRLGLRVMGLLGVLLVAKERRAISSVRKVLDQLRRGTSFRMSQDLERRVIEAAGEAE